MLNLNISLLDILLWGLIALTVGLIMNKFIVLRLAAIGRIARPIHSVTAAKRQGSLDKGQLADVVATRVRELSAGLPWLATIASTAPFVGLAGTVWHLMGALGSLPQGTGGGLGALTGQLSAALHYTLLGLAAAIPSAAAYNLFAHKLEDWREEGNGAVNARI